jgi:hypothetical protein
MADKKISALTASATPLAGTEVLPIVQSGSTVKVSVANLTAGRAVSASSLTASTDNVIIGTNGKGVTTGSAIPLRFGVNNAVSAVTINTDNNVGINTSETPLKLNILSGVATADTTTPLVLLGSDRSDFYASINSVRGAFSTVIGMSFSTTNGGAITERMRIAPDGNITATTGNFVVGTAGQGIDFSANTGAAGMTSELLDWYEEGTFIPTLSGATTTTYTTQTGRYTRIGRQVFFQCEIQINAIGDGSTTIALLGDLPATAVTSVAPVAFFAGLATSVVFIGGFIGGAGGNSVQFQSLTAAASATAPNAIFQDGARVIFSGQYSV